MPGGWRVGQALVFLLTKRSMAGFIFFIKQILGPKEKMNFGPVICLILENKRKGENVFYLLFC